MGQTAAQTAAKKRNRTSDSSKARVQRYRDRKRAEKTIEGAGVTSDPAAIKQAAAAMVTAQVAAQSTADQTATMGDAFAAGMAAAMFRTILDGNAGREHELRKWLGSRPPCKWMFLHYLTQQGIYGDFLDWSGESVSASAG